MTVTNVTLWNAESHTAFADAERLSVLVRVKCCLRVSGILAEMVLYGKLREVAGRECVFMVQESQVSPDKSKEEENFCEFFFSLERPSESGGIERLGFQGAALILDISKDACGDIRQLRLRLSKSCSVRKMRRDKRVPWGVSRSRLAGVVLVSPQPSTREGLRTILAGYCQANPAPIQFVNISAGGLCACLPDQIALPALSGGSAYLVFFIPHNAPPKEPPYIFLAKKLGLSRECCDTGNAVRLRFVEELDWTNARPGLHWLDIEYSGSDRLRLCLEAYEGEEDRLLSA